VRTDPEHRPRRAAKRSKGPVIVVIIAVVALVVGGGAAAAYWIPRLLDDSDQPGIAKSAEEAVREYLAALAAGDATTALLYSAAQPADTRFMTNDFLAKVVAGGPVTDIVVPDGQTSVSPAQITATYKMGDQAVEAHFTVQKYGRDWLLDAGYLSLGIGAAVAKGVPLALNGVELGTMEKVYLFPGVYEFTSLDVMLAMDNGKFTIGYAESQPTIDMGFSLSKEGIDRIRTAAKAKLDWCLAQKALKPAGCGFGFTGAQNGTVSAASIKWGLKSKSQKPATIAPRLDGGSLTTAVAPFAVTVSFQAQSEDKTSLYNDESGFTRLHADFTDPGKIVVTFGS